MIPEMPSKARDYRETTKKRLFILSNNKCYNPICNKKLISSLDEESIVAKIAHIEAASANGPRYRADMTDDE